MQLPLESGTVPGRHHFHFTLHRRSNSVTCKRNLIDTVFVFGICVSYNHLLQLTANIANGVCQCFQIDNVACTLKMHNVLFTTAAVDNIDYNPSYAAAKDSFHGTGISLIHILHICLQDLTMVMWSLTKPLAQIGQLFLCH